MTSADKPQSISLAEHAAAAWRGRRVAALFFVLATALLVAYVVVTDRMYEARSTLALAESSAENPITAMAGSLSGIASLAGISMDVGLENKEVAIATLKSRDVARRFILENDLLPVLAPESGGLRDWIGLSSNMSDASRLAEAVERFSKEVFSVSRDRLTGLLQVTVRWDDPGIAADWVTGIVRLTNHTLRERALRDAENRIEFLAREAESATSLDLRQAILGVMERELQVAAVARTRENYAFLTIDQAVPPDASDYVWPPKVPMLALAGIGLAILAIGLGWAVQLARDWRLVR